MTPVSNNHNDQQPKGNLEDLFRQKFAEAELTPRADVWERLDHELLLRENQGYRRRLTGYRRVAAAACGLLTLGFGTWLTQQQGPQTGSAGEVAGVVAERTRPEAAADYRTGEVLSPEGKVALSEASGANLLAAGAYRGSREVAASGRAIGSGARGTAARVAGANSEGQARRSVVAVAALGQYTPASVASRALSSIKQTFGAGAETGDVLPQQRGVQNGDLGSGSTGYANAARFSTGSATAANIGLNTTVADAWTTEVDELQPLTAELQRAAVPRPDSLKASLLSAPMLLAAQLPADNEQRDEEKAAGASRWRWRGGYAANRFAPHVSGATGGGIALNKTEFANRVATNAAVAAPNTPTKLDAGLSHRVHLGAAVPLGKKHWTLITGAELMTASGNTARETPQQYQIILPSNFARDNNVAEPQEGRYRFITAGVPVQLRYEGRKQGWGVYAALGTAVNVLLRNSTTIGNETVTNDGAYRRVLVSARSSAGVRYAPAGGQWVLAFGPEAETGLNTINVNPSGRWNERTRPYAVGLAASVEFGGGKTEVLP